MANGHGGIRQGSGRRRKTVTEKVLEGKLKGNIPNLKAQTVEGSFCPEPHGYMEMATKNAGENIAKMIYGEIYDWLKERKCAHLVQPQIVEQYALSFARYSQAETAIHQYGLLAKSPSNGNAVPSPFIEISQNYLKQTQNIWLTIFAAVKDKCDIFTNPENDDIMELILTGRYKGKQEADIENRHE